MKLTLGKKTFISLGVLTAALLAVAAAGYWGISGLSAEMQDIVDVHLPTIEGLAVIDERITDIQSNERLLLVNHYDAAQRQHSYQVMTAAFAKIDEARRAYEPLPQTPEEAQLWQRFVPAFDTWKEHHMRVEEVEREVDRIAAAGASASDPAYLAAQERAYEAAVAARERRAAAQDTIAQIEAIYRRLATEDAQRADKVRAAAELTIGVAALLGLIVALFTTVFLSRNIAAILRSLMSESEKLTASVHEGQTRARADVESINFEFRPVVQSMNDTMEAFSKPMGVMTDCVERIGRGDLPPRVTDAYRGDFDKMKNSLNCTIDAVRLMVADSAALAKGAVEGTLKNRAEASGHQGDFARVITGINDTLDAVIKPMEESAGVLAILANRDLRARVKGDYAGDHANMKDSINTMAESLHAAITQVTGTTDQLSAASEQIAASSQTVSQGTTEQASALGETSSTLEEIASMTRQNADNTQQAKALAQATKVAASAGSISMAQMVESMGKLRAAAEGTAEIIRDINEIAFQTNLLAVNAAVEAARAGDAGRGFAVVAEEVRNLALRSKEAAKKTKELIKLSVKLAEEGGTISHAVSGNLAGIVTSVSKVTDIVGEIAIASQEQARGVDQVNKAIQQMGQAVQQSAANSEETSSSAAELSSQAQDLAALAGSFQLGSMQTAVRASARKFGAAPRLATPRHRTLPSRSTTNGHGLRPEDLIPMDQDPDFREF